MIKEMLLSRVQGTYSKYYMIILFLFLGCHSVDEEKCVNFDSQIIRAVLKNSIINEAFWGDGYLIYPYFDSFSLLNDFDPRSNLKNSKYKKILNIDYNSFLRLKEKVNERYLGDYCSLLKKHNAQQKSNTVIFFSGYSKNFFFINIYKFNRVIEYKELTDDFNFKDRSINSFGTYVVFLNPGEISNVKLVNSGSFM